MSRYGPKPIPPLQRLRRRTVGYGTDGCWVSDLNLDRDGYSHFRTGSSTDGSRRVVKVHRWAYEELVGPIPNGFEIDHRQDLGCVSRACWNPDHLEPVTHAVNVYRSRVGVGKRTGFCHNGHERTDFNLTSRGHCRICRSDSAARYALKIRNAA